MSGRFRCLDGKPVICRLILSFLACKEALTIVSAGHCCFLAAIFRESHSRQLRHERFVSDRDFGLLAWLKLFVGLQ